MADKLNKLLQANMELKTILQTLKAGNEPQEPKNNEPEPEPKSNGTGDIDYDVLAAKVAESLTKGMVQEPEPEPEPMTQKDMVHAVAMEVVKSLISEPGRNPNFGRKSDPLTVSDGGKFQVGDTPLNKEGRANITNKAMMPINGKMVPIQEGTVRTYTHKDAAKIMAERHSGSANPLNQYYQPA